MDFSGDPNTWDAMTWDAAAKDIVANGPTGQAFGLVAKWAENKGFLGQDQRGLTDMAVMQKIEKTPQPPQPTPLENIKSLLGGKMFGNPNKNPYPGRTALGRNAGEIFGNAAEQRPY